MIPDKEQILDAAKLDGFDTVKQLQGYKCKVLANGLPFYMLGGFGIAIKIEKGNSQKALKAWTCNISDIKERMQEVAHFLKTNPMSYFVGYDFYENGLHIKDELSDDYVDILVMEWADGLRLKNYVRSLINERIDVAKEKLHELELALTNCFSDLYKNHVSHGDLQQDNIIVKENSNGEITIKLIDYDSLCVPSLAGRPLVTAGYADYQHPQRINESDKLLSSERDDYFSEKIILASLQLLQAKPELWSDPNVDAESNEHGLLFRSDDFTNFENCYLYKQGMNTQAESMIKEIGLDLKKNVKDIEPLEIIAQNSDKAKIQQLLDLLEMLLDQGIDQEKINIVKKNVTEKIKLVEDPVTRERLWNKLVSIKKASIIDYLKYKL